MKRLTARKEEKTHTQTHTKIFLCILICCAMENTQYTSWAESLPFIWLWLFFLRGPEGTSVHQRSTEQMAMSLKVKINRNTFEVFPLPKVFKALGIGEEGFPVGSSVYYCHSLMSQDIRLDENLTTEMKKEEFCSVKKQSESSLSQRHLKSVRPHWAKSKTKPRA